MKDEVKGKGGLAEETDMEMGGKEGLAVCVDVYVDRRDKVWVLDVAPWGPPTDSLLFEWVEAYAEDDSGGHVPWKLDSMDGRQGISAGGKEHVIYRVGDGDISIKPDPWSSCRVPLEMKEHMVEKVLTDTTNNGESEASEILDLQAIQRTTLREQRGGEKADSSDSTDDGAGIARINLL